MEQIEVKREHSKLLASYQGLSARLSEFGGDPQLGDLLGGIDRQLTVCREIVFGSREHPWPSPGDADLSRALQAVAAGHGLVSKARARVAEITTERNLAMAAKRTEWMDGVASSMTPDVLVRTIEADGQYQLSVDAAGSLRVAPDGLSEHLLHALRYHLEPVRAIVNRRRNFTLIG